MVIHTYSVLIQNQKTMELFSQYQPLFAEAINSNRIGICKWIESGTTVDTALPELSTLTDDKKEWRAIIVRYVDDNSMAAFESDPRNPFDYLINKDADGFVEESPIPIVRLAQMLGGVPPLEIKFKPEIIKEKHKAPRTIYVPINDEEQESAHRKLIAKYRFDGKMPSSVLFITIRDKSLQDESIGRSWIAHKESDSSEFWKRNRFPSICRFLAVDFAKQGPIQKEADDFKFWCSVMLMATNEWDSSTLQAYRLYTLSLEMDRPAMSDSFQVLVDRLRDAKHCLEKSIKKDIENQICEEENLPEYRINVTVSPKLPKTDDCHTKQSAFGLLSRGSSSDVAIWTRQKNEVEEQFAASVRTAERTLDQTADKMRSVCSFTEEEVDPLNKYQIEDLERETDEIYHQVVNIQSKLPKGNVGNSEAVQDSAQRVKENLLGRVMAKPALTAIGLLVELVLLSSIPAIINSISLDGKYIEVIAIVVIACSLLSGLCGLSVLVIQKMKLNSLIGDYNHHIQNAFNKLVDNAGQYSDYMSGIASHSRGRSYLALTSRKRHRSDVEHYSKYKHIKAINILLGKLNAWSKAFQLNVDFTSKRPDSRVVVDTSIAPIENKVYLFESGASYDVAINHSGMTMKSPYCFAKKIEIVREELYENE